MNPNWAEENLQTIRTLMERSAVYRRALAPIMLLAGALGVMAAVTGVVCHLDSAMAFGALWYGTAVAAVTGAFLIARRQALKDHEPFWSPPTRRVTQALVPPLAVGFLMGLSPLGLGGPNLAAAILWILFYGCALHAAGFFMPRGIKYFGWLFILSGGVLFWVFCASLIRFPFAAHGLMGFFFGGLHLLYGGYLHLTEKRKNVP